MSCTCKEGHVTTFSNPAIGYCLLNRMEIFLFKKKVFWKIGKDGCRELGNQLLLSLEKHNKILDLLHSEWPKQNKTKHGLRLHKLNNG